MDDICNPDRVRGAAGGAVRGAVPGGAGPARQGPVPGRAGRAAAAGVAGLVVAGGAGAAAAANQVSVLCGVTNERRVSPGQPGLGPGAGQTLRLALGRVHRPGLHLGEGAGGTHQARVLGIVTVLTVLCTNSTINCVPGTWASSGW